MFQAVLCLFSGGQIVSLQHLVSSLSVNGRTVFSVASVGPVMSFTATHVCLWISNNQQFYRQVQIPSCLFTTSSRDWF